MNKLFMYYSYISALAYASASIVFYAYHKNWQGGTWALFAAIIAGVCFFLLKLFFKNKLEDHFQARTIDYLHVFGFVTCLVGSAFSIWYLFTIVYWKIPIFDYEHTSVFPCVFSFITGKWGLHLYTNTKVYLQHIGSNYTPLVQAF